MPLFSFTKHFNISITSINKYGANGSPCLVPRCNLNYPVEFPLLTTNAAAKSAPKRIPGILFLSVSYNTSETNLTVSPISLFLIKAFCSGPIILHEAFCILFANILLNIFKSTFNRLIGLQDLIKVWSFPGF